MSQSPMMGESRNIFVESGVNEKLEPFVRVTLEGTYKGRPVRLLGQLSPDEVRAWALAWLTTAEAAESDAIVAQELIETIGLEYQPSVQFIAALRHRRKNSD